MSARRGTAFVLAKTLAVSVVLAITAPVASAAGPSVGLPDVPSTPVAKQTRTAPGADQASASTLTGDQPARAAKEGGGTATATSLSPSASWSVAAHTGDFTWSYPLRVPPAPGGLEPSLALSYRSSAVDGRTTVTNNQPSWVGDGWSLSSGFVERTYGGCAADTDGGTTPPQTGDLCWKSDNATASYGGGGGTLIRDDATGQWRSRADDGSRIERLTGAGNGDNDGEHWRITTVDGTQYFFGSQNDSASTWTVPVFGDDANEPCHGATFDTSHCVQAYRWMLDKVVDRNGNIVRYFYKTEGNSYGLNLKDAAVPYVRGGYLDHIDYGLRDNVTQPSGRIVFTTSDRCVKDSTCAPDKPDNWPDTFWEGKCDTATCKDHYSPTFWSTKRLASVTTKVWRGNAFSDVDRWDLDTQFPDPGDGEKAALWLKGIKHTGLVGGTADMPSVTFEGTAMYNRVELPQDGVSPLSRYRVTGVISETGGLTSIQYASECAAGGPTPANPETNTLRCFPVRWAKKNHAERTDYFHKYVVARVTQSDRLKVDSIPQSTFSEQVTAYEYLDGAAWHYDTSEFTKDDQRTWNDFRGFGRVRVRTGAPNDPAGPVTMTEQRFYRGMDGDKLPSGSRPASVTDTEGGTRADSDWLAGFGFETSTFEREGPSNQADPPRVSKSISDPVVQGPTATRGTFKAYLVKAGVQRGFTALAAGGWRATRSETTYDDRGMPTRINDLGDLATADDDRCTRTEYARNTDAWLLRLPGHVETVSVHCGQTAVFPGDALSDTRSTYDGNGNLKKSEVAKDRPASGPVYLTTSTADYDVHGRATTATDALGNVTKTAYTPAVGGPLTQAVSTSPPTPAVPAGLVTTTTLEPAWGSAVLVNDPNSRKTETGYDPLGRTAKVWLPDWTKAAHPNAPSVRHTYLVRGDGPSAITSSKIGPKGNEISGVAIYDGLLRIRQVQAPAPGGGRLLADIRYDSQGRDWKSTQPYFNDAAVDTELWVAGDEKIPGHTRSHYDGAGREDASIYFSGAFEKWRTSKAYGGDRVHTTPPPGAAASTTIVDAQGRTTERRVYRSGTPDGTFDATKYTYTKAGQPDTVTDATGAVWRSGYDLLGRKTSSADPDTGTSLMTYDDGGRLATVKDARGTTLGFAYDALGRMTTKSAGATKLAEWTYDTVVKGKGQPAGSTRWVGGKPYVNKVLSYDAAYRPTGTSTVVPSTEGLLAGTYNSYAGYNPDGSLSSSSFAAAGELPAETVNYVYDDAGQLKSSSGGYDGATTALVSNTDYTRYGELARLQLGEGTKRAWLSQYYEGDTRRLQRSIVDAEVPAPMQSDVRFTYDKVGLITSIAEATTGDVQCFGADKLLRVTEAWTAAPSTWSETDGCRNAPGTAGPAPYWHSYTYDQSGNRKTETRHAAAGDTIRTYATELPGRPHALSSVSTQGPGVNTQDTYDYDASGNLKTKTAGGAAEQYTWDEEGRLASVAKAGKSTSFLFDAEDDRLIRRAPDATTLYLGGQELRLNASGGNPTVTRYYGFGGKTVAMRQGRGALTWLAGDHQGTPQVAIDSGSLQVVRRDQLPFGGGRGAATAFPGDRGFVGGVRDAGTGLTHLGAREYDPDTGRFISVDPVLNAADSQQLNGYTYSNNNPISFSDPSGLYCDSCDFYSHRDETPSAFNPNRPGDFPQHTPVVTLQQQQRQSSAAPARQKVSPQTVSRRDQAETGIGPNFETWVIQDLCAGDPGSTIKGTDAAALACMEAYGELQRATGKQYRIDVQKRRAQEEKDKAYKVAHAYDDVTALANCAMNPAMLDVCFRPHGTTFAVCAGAGFHMVAGIGGEVCVAIDDQGVGWSATGKAGISGDTGANYGLGAKLAQGSIEDLGGKGEYYGVPVGPTEIGVSKSDSGLYSAGLGFGRHIGKTSSPIQKLEGVSLGTEAATSGRFFDMKEPVCRVCQNISTPVYNFLFGK
ncbi:RHS repeat-associated core domain-containing protein [Amycolatopsis sp. cg5]|uniref:RHS repeat-associated core domain-containing protein n=1 Tax=Amycolatopsis sp. cg5 TaxID=3238802 RepID=UPI003525C4B2